LKSSDFHSLGESEELVEDTNTLGNVSGNLAEDVSVSELETEVVSSGHDESNPSTSSEDTIPSVVDGFTEGHREDSGVGFLKESETEKGDVVNLNGEVDVTVHGALEFCFNFRH